MDLQHHVLGENPDLVREGITIVIPRSKRGYQRLLVKLKALQMQIQYSSDREMFLVECDYNRLQANRVLLDAAGDALATIATFNQSFGSTVPKNIYLYTHDQAGHVSCFQTAGTWSVPAFTNQAPSVKVISVSSSSGSGS